MKKFEIYINQQRQILGKVDCSDQELCKQVIESFAGVRVFVATINEDEEFMGTKVCDIPNLNPIPKDQQLHGGYWSIGYNGDQWD